jgi:hypothetical protein
VVYWDLDLMMMLMAFFEMIPGLAGGLVTFFFSWADVFHWDHYRGCLAVHLGLICWLNRPFLGHVVP